MEKSTKLGGVARGRGAQSNRSGRFEATTKEDFDDGWREMDREPLTMPQTLTALKSRTILTRNDSPDIGFDKSINPYVGCSHGCIYCYARPSHAFMGLSPGLDFESKIFFKPDAAALLERELSAPRYRVSKIQIGANTDPYQPAERTRPITRQILDVLDRFNHPASLITKSALIVRDIDILASLAERGLVKVFVSITSLDRALSRAMEPRAATPERRLWAVSRLAEAGVPVGVGFAPAIPGLNDHEMESVLERAWDAGAREAMYVVLRLPQEIKDLFREWLEAARPDRARRVMSLVRQMRGGRDYDPAWGARMRGEGPIADLLSRRFAIACERLGFNLSPVVQRIDLFSPPRSPSAQMDLFS